MVGLFIYFAFRHSINTRFIDGYVQVDYEGLNDE